MHRVVSSKTLVKGALALTISTFISKLLSAGYRIPYQNIVGDKGFYIYQQVYPFYAAVFILSTYGFPVLISKWMIEYSDVNESTEEIIAKSTRYLFIVSIISFCVFFFCSDVIATLMGDHNLSIVLKSVSYTYLFMPFISVGKGFFQGRHEMIPSAIAQFVEQFGRFLIILVICYFVFIKKVDLYTGGAGAIFGSVFGGLLATIVIGLYIRRKQPDFKRFYRKRTNKLKDINFFQFLYEGVALCASYLFIVLLQMVDAVSMLTLLHESVASVNEAKIIKGIFDRGQPLLQFGTVLTSAFSLSLIPYLSQARKRSELHVINEKVNTTLKISILVGLGASLGLIAIIEPVNIMLFRNAQGSLILAVLMASVLFNSMIMALSALLNGTGEVTITLRIIVIGALIKLLLNVILIPQFGSLGAALATVGAFFIVTLLLLLQLKRSYQLTLFTKGFIIKTIIAGSIMVLFIKAFQLLFNDESRLMATIEALSATILGGIVYFAILFWFNILNFKDILKRLWR